MVKDAEAHAEEDRKFQALVGARNQADSLVHASKKSLEELKDKMSDAERQQLEDAIKATEAAMAGEDVADIEAKAQQLGELSGKIAGQAHQADQQASGAAGGGGARPDGGASDNVVDADFEEVKDDK
jgi:molecular chaperone DnaK